MMSQAHMIKHVMFKMNTKTFHVQFLWDGYAQETRNLVEPLKSEVKE